MYVEQAIHPWHVTNAEGYLSPMRVVPTGAQKWDWGRCIVGRIRVVESDDGCGFVALLAELTDAWPTFRTPPARRAARLLDRVTPRIFALKIDDE